jgi:shikimate dehydrogenase
MRLAAELSVADFQGWRMQVKRAGVIGWPVEHARSPMIHGYWLKRYGIEGEYRKIAVPPAEAAAFFDDLAAHDLIGCNVTVPYKEVAFRAADHPDAAAQSAKAANTLWLEDGVLCAANTDIYGFITNLDAQAPGWDSIGLPAAVLGAGGAARGIIRGLLDRGVPHIRLANRTRERAEALAEELRAAVSVVAWDSRNEMLADCGLLVNTTTLGMRGQPPLDIDLTDLSRPGVVCDIVYIPLETDLLKNARAAGFHTADGLGMLLHQAVPGFEKWFGVRPEVTPELRALVAADIEGK